MMNEKFIFTFVLVAMISVSFGSAVVSSNPNMVACAQDAMICPNGLSVSRTGSNCEFVCPPIVACSDIYKPVCGQPPMPDCPNGLECMQMMPVPKTYSNECIMRMNGATFLYDGECKSNVDCAKVGEQFSSVFTDQYPTKCCNGLKEWQSGFDTRKVVDGKCVETGLESGSPVGTCLSCGDGVCEGKENVCNCPEDCSITKTCENYPGPNFCKKDEMIVIVGYDDDNCPKYRCDKLDCMVAMPDCAVGYKFSYIGDDEKGCAIYKCIPDTACAKVGEQFSSVYTDRYPTRCCNGLKEWYSGMDTRKVVDGKCIVTKLLSGLPVGTCLSCGDKVCEGKENVCNCPEDCSLTKTCENFPGPNFCEENERIENIGKDINGCSIYKCFPIDCMIAMPDCAEGFKFAYLGESENGCPKYGCVPEIDCMVAMPDCKDNEKVVYVGDNENGCAIYKCVPEIECEAYLIDCALGYNMVTVGFEDNGCPINRCFPEVCNVVLPICPVGQKAVYAEDSESSCPVFRCEEVMCSDIYSPVCGQPPMPSCPEGLACTQMMPAPRTYSNKCVLEAHNAEYLYDGECKDVACKEDAKICPDGSSVGRVAPDCEFEKCPEVKACDTGCIYNNDNCLPIGTRVEGKYCDIDKELKSQKTSELTCENNYECSSNLCVDGSCVEGGLIQKILNWFSRIMG